MFNFTEANKKCSGVKIILKLCLQAVLPTVATPTWTELTPTAQQTAAWHRAATPPPPTRPKVQVCVDIENCLVVDNSIPTWI